MTRKMGEKKRICFAVQRYGREIVGGAEALCMQYVRALKDFYDIEVITSCATDYNTWANEYPAGKVEIDGVPVYRYPARHPRIPKRLGPLTEKIYADPDQSMALGKKWLKEVGPYCPGIIKHIKKQKQEYDCFVFVGYHYYNSTFGLPCAAEKAIFLPTAHDEPPLRSCNYFKYLFSLPRAYIFLSEAERDFVMDYFKLCKDIPYAVTGAWVELEDKGVRNPDGGYVAYAGRIDQTKNCHLLFQNFIQFKEKFGGNTKLVLMGKNYMELPERDDIIYLGFVDEAQKARTLREATAFIMPSENESLSIGVLEALSCGTPVLVNGRCAVLKKHIEISGAGASYEDDTSFADALWDLTRDRSRNVEMGNKGIAYVEQYYTKENIIAKLKKIIEETADRS